LYDSIHVVQLVAVSLSSCLKTAVKRVGSLTSNAKDTDGGCRPKSFTCDGNRSFGRRYRWGSHSVAPVLNIDRRHTRDQV